MKTPPLIWSKQEKLSRALQEAWKLHQRGQLDQAQRRYRKILAEEPNLFDAKYLLGVLRLQQGKYVEAESHLCAAMRINPMVAAGWANLGLVYQNLGQLEDALVQYDRALAIKPGSFAALNNRGVALLGLKRPED